MAKTKTPFFSLGSHGSIADALTSQKRASATLIRKKPTPAYRYTLLQAYQRWLYEDYAYLWRQQSQATRQEYATAGTRFHLTGFQYWMKYHLTNLPDIVGWWKLDEKAGAIAYDSGRGGYNGAIIGPSPIDSIIAGGYSYDGLNDLVTIPSIPPPAFTELTVLCFVSLPAFTAALRYVLFWGLQAAPFGMMYVGRNAINNDRFYLRNTAGAITAVTYPFTPNTFFLGGCMWDGTDLFSIHDKLITPGSPFVGVVSPNDILYLGREKPPAGPDWYDGLEDNLIIFNRALDATEIARWASRRYPL